MGNKSVYTLDRFASEFGQIRKFAGPTDLVSRAMDFFRPSREEMLERVERILAATTPAERGDPSSIGPAEYARIAEASRLEVRDVERFFAGFAQLSDKMDELARKTLLQRLRMALPWVLFAALAFARALGV